MYVKSLYVRNFRNFDHTTAVFTAPASAIIGENGTGKSNLVHALRLLLDPSLSRQVRLLEEDDFHDRSSIALGKEIIISAVLTDFESNDEDRAYCSQWKTAPDIAAVTFRFRPGITARLEAAERASAIGAAAAKKKEANNGEAEDETLLPWEFRLADYDYERVGGLSLTSAGGLADVATVTPSDDFGVTAEKKLNEYVFVELPAIRDVVRDMNARRTSPLHRLIDLIKVPEAVKTTVESSVKAANKAIRAEPFFQAIQDAIDSNYDALAAVPDKLSVKIGLADPTFASAIRTMMLLMSDSALEEAEMYRNGLGFNNLLYIAILLEYFKQRAVDKGTNQILVIEEPEAHLHPNAQRALMRRMAEKTHQTIVTSHSPSSLAALGVAAVTAVVKTGSSSIAVRPIDAINATPVEIADLDRYLDGNRSAMLFARWVVLVEGLSEEIILTRLAERRQLDLAGKNIAIVSVSGTYFELFARLFSSGALPTKCSLVRDGDAQNDPAWLRARLPDDGSRVPPWTDNGVSIHRCTSTLEMALTQPTNVDWIVQTLIAVGAPIIAASVDVNLRSADPARVLLAQLAVLRTAKRIRKGRFAQALADNMSGNETVPKYLDSLLQSLL